MRAWPPSVERVAVHLGRELAEARIEQLRTSAASAEDAARALGCEPAQVVKSLLFECDGTPVLVLVPGDRRADAAKVAAAAGASAARIASAARVEEATGYPPGGVSPFALARVERVLLERTLLSQPRVWVGAGSASHLAGLAPTELLRLARAVPVDAVGSGT